ncbi:trypsin-like peptidase domain-containing protein [uncultured Corynebacterium sp.]|uniref:S1C family serine protease n=1 Tax=uncultured Corynebacterium sp. TaxID=159447 RepID=UPI0025EB9C03|nr:trypsin-like peptidase domain-containing protein [uncultured Corynebacterium sp.]
MGENNSGDGQRMPGEPDFSNSGQKPVQGGDGPQGGVHRDHMRWNGQQGQPQRPNPQPASQPFPQQQPLQPQQRPQPQPTSVQEPSSGPSQGAAPAQGPTPAQALGQESFADPYQPQLSSQPQEKKRWSTPAVAALLLAGAVVASAVTYVGMDTINGNQASNNATSSFDNSNSSSKSSQEKKASNPVKPGSTTDIANKVLPSVVSIRVTTSRGGEEGSGSIISSDGLILTNNHVVAGAEDGKAKVEVILNDGRSLEAEVVATDPQTDIAVIKAKNVTDLQPIEFGDSDSVNVGEDVMAIGSPLGLSATVTTGIVSAKNRPVQASGEDGGEASLIDAIQTDASINPGNSGGALVDMEGKLIGIPSVIASTGGGEVAGSIGLGFAIPINQAERISKQLIDNGKAEHPMIGAKVDTRSNENGAVIADVNKDSPADKAGLKKGDVVTHVDDRRVDSGVGLIAAIRSHAVGDKVKLKVKEGPDGEEREVELTLTTAE